MSFKLSNFNETAPLVGFAIDAATIVGPNKFVTLDGSNLIIEADATATKLGFTIGGSKDGDTEILLIDNINEQAIFEGTMNAPFDPAVHKGNTFDLAISAPDQVLNVGATATNVLRVLPDNRAGFLGATGVQVKIALGL